tara:strand:- start:112 stop:339 length:228 start_codon:yes stop_codon:yes gene_type:complete
MTTETYKLSDATIAQIVQLVQMGILTGTDVSDQIRTLRVTANDTGFIEPDPEFVEIFNENLERLRSQASNEKSSL